MKNFTVINEQIHFLEKEYAKKKEQHSKLDQIAMLSMEGATIRNRMNLITGMMHALRWVVDNNNIGELYETK